MRDKRSAIRNLFLDWMEIKGFRPGFYEAGYDREEGDFYAFRIQHFFKRLGLSKWEVSMHWEADSSWLVAEREVTSETDGPFKVRTTERFEITDVLGSASNFEALLDSFLDDVFILAHRVGKEPVVPSTEWEV